MFIADQWQTFEVIDTGSGEVISEIKAPENGTVLFIQSNPLAFADSQLILLVR